MRRAPNKLDLSGQTYGRLTCLEETAGRLGGSVVWKCRCSCGAITYASATNIRTGNTQSCGCWQIDVSCSVFDGKEHPEKRAFRILPEALRQARSAAQLTLAELGAKTGLRSQQLHRPETTGGHIYPSFATKIAKAVKTKTETLRATTPKPGRRPPRDR